MMSGEALPHRDAKKSPRRNRPSDFDAIVINLGPERQAFPLIIAAQPLEALSWRHSRKAIIMAAQPKSAHHGPSL
jgi:hypothetical protein